VSGVLAKILARKAEEVVALRKRSFPPGPEPRPLGLRRGPSEPLRLIAEIKRRSPSAGPLSAVLGVAERAAAYERAGASMLSVLSDTQFFDGAFEHLAEARAATRLPVLCKEFVVDEVQLDAARSFGADAVLLIVRFLSPERLSTLMRAARERGLAPFVEVVDVTEAKVALEAGATLVGVNARDLDTLKMDPVRAARTLAGLPDGVTAVHLSGLATPEAVVEVAQGTADAALVGEALMRKDDPEPLLRELVAAASQGRRP
jgi:indole-3-glycerol phosphate synthase